jgi:hypothetical protein
MYKRVMSPNIGVLQTERTKVLNLTYVTSVLFNALFSPMLFAYHVAPLQSKSPFCLLPSQACVCSPLTRPSTVFQSSLYVSGCLVYVLRFFKLTPYIHFSFTLDFLPLLFNSFRMPHDIKRLQVWWSRVFLGAYSINFSKFRISSSYWNELAPLTQKGRIWVEI